MAASDLLPWAQVIMTSRRNSVGCAAPRMGGSHSLCSHALRRIGICIRRATIVWVSQSDSSHVASTTMHDDTTGRGARVVQRLPPHRRAQDCARRGVDGDPRRHLRPENYSCGHLGAVSWSGLPSTARCPTWRSEGRHGVSQGVHSPRTARIAAFRAQVDDSRRGTARA